MHGIVTKCFRCVDVLLVGLLLVPLGMAQTGSVSGSVIAWVPADSVQVPLQGANISIPTVDLGAVTDLDGEFHVTGVPVGTYDLEARFLGYQPKIVGGISVRENQATIVEIFLGEEFRFPYRLGQCRDDGMGVRAVAIDTQMDEPTRLSMTEVGPWGDLRGIRLLGDSLYSFVRPIDASMDPPITSWQAPIDSTLSNEVVQIVSDAIDGAADDYAGGVWTAPPIGS